MDYFWAAFRILTDVITINCECMPEDPLKNFAYTWEDIFFANCSFINELHLSFQDINNRKYMICPLWRNKCAHGPSYAMSTILLEEEQTTS